MTRKRLNLGIERMEDRQLMAADVAMVEIAQIDANVGQVEIAPAVPQNDGLRQQASSRSGNNGFEIRPNWYTNRLNLIISGTSHNDEIVISELQNGYIRVTGTTTNDAGTQLGSYSEDFHPNAFVHIFAVMGDGDDRFINELTNKTAFVYGGADDDFLNSAGRAQLFGQAGDDVLWGSAFNDFISGGNGEDFLYGRDGNDTLNGDGFNDLMYGGAGHDRMDGGSGFDRMYGHSGNDVMRGGVGEDFMDGGWDNDIMFGGDHDDVMEGGSGNDIMRGQKGNDDLDGESGHDRLDGGSGDDFLIGGTGDDELIGRSGFDRLFGGADDDILDGGDDGVADLIHGGRGDDTFVRHKHFFTLDDPDQFLDYKSDPGDKRFDDWGWADFGDDFPEEDDYFNV